MSGKLLWVIFLFTCAVLPARAAPQAERLTLLARGVNVTNWFRYPPSLAPVALRTYLSDAAIEQLRSAGFSFVRLPIQPELIESDPPTRVKLIVSQIHRLERHGLAVVVVLHPSNWRLEDSAADRARLIASWRLLAPALSRLDPALTFPELLNEPVFSKTTAQWAALQTHVLEVVRAAMPNATIVVSGGDWSSIKGLEQLQPVADANVVYTIHLYEPAELTSLAAYRPGLDRSAFARLPFPVTSQTDCERAAGESDPASVGLARFYCAQHWNEQAIADRLDTAVRWARAHDAALLLGEFGASAELNAPARLAWIAAARRAAERDRIGWALWGYDDVMGFNLPRPPPVRPTLDPDLLRALGLDP